MQGIMDDFSLQGIRQNVNSALSQFEPLMIVVASISTWLVLTHTTAVLTSTFSAVTEKGLVAWICGLGIRLIKIIPGGAAIIQKEQDKVLKKLQSGTKEKESWATELPKHGMGPAVIGRMQELKDQDRDWQGRCSGAVYIGGAETEGHFRLVNEAYCMFAHTNPLHPDVFPSIPRFEAEVVAMTAAMLGSKLQASGGQVCGNMTSGGTESILMAVKSTRDFMRATRGITAPEMVIPQSAHSAYDKAAQYFQIKLRRAPVAANFRADVKAMKRLINKNTIMLVGSCPGFPHGVIDPIEEISALALQYKVCLHVDLCLGGFVLPFAKKLGYPIPPFDFRVPGVTSISIDVHKYGLGPKGTSTVLYRNHEIRKVTNIQSIHELVSSSSIKNINGGGVKYQFVAVSEWSGGLYISPSMAGSRAGALIAGAWASMMCLGENGYLDITRKLMDTARKIELGVGDIEGLYVLGKPDMTVIAFASKEVNIYKVNSAMAEKGWSLNALHKPESVHICITLQHLNVVDDFLSDLSDSVKYVRNNPDKFGDGMAPIYGAAATMPDRGSVRDLLIAYMDGTC